jgi:hypothetical protein
MVKAGGRLRCRRCKRLIGRGREAQERFAEFEPYCCSECQQYGRLDEARQRINEMRWNIDFERTVVPAGEEVELGDVTEKSETKS